MEIDLMKLNKPYEINEDITAYLHNYSNKNIKEVNSAFATGTIYFGLSDTLKVDINLKGEMTLIDSVTLDTILYPYDIKIEEEYDINEPYFEEYYKKSRNILDIISILWENIVLEVPIRITTTNDAVYSGEGWSMGNNSKNENNIDPRLAKLAEILDERKE